jgi:radical SAM/Cys-rich protein
MRVENMEERTAERILELLKSNKDVGLLDLTGGAPEMNPHFRRLVSGARSLGRDVCVRSNLTILLEPGYEDMIGFFADNRVIVVASLPCYTAENVDAQRGKGVFDDSIEALRRLNAVGYGVAGGDLVLDLVYNPLGASLPGPQEQLRDVYRRELAKLFGVTFNDLYTITNMPIKRFSDQLRRQGKEESYMDLLVESFNAQVVGEVMCHDLVSIGYDGRIYDCDFNQMLELPLGLPEERLPFTIWDVDDLATLTGKRIRTGPHCFGCTAGAGSSCGGALV